MKQVLLWDSLDLRLESESGIGWQNQKYSDCSYHGYHGSLGTWSIFPWLALPRSSPMGELTPFPFLPFYSTRWNRLFFPNVFHVAAASLMPYFIGVLCGGFILWGVAYFCSYNWELNTILKYLLIFHLSVLRKFLLPLLWGHCLLHMTACCRVWIPECCLLKGQ